MRNIKFDVPTKSSVSEENKAILEKIEGGVGFVPNIYATYALSNNALARYTAFANGKTSLNNKEKEVVNLVVSQINGCTYCLAAHTAIGKMNGFSEKEILEIRKGTATFHPKFDALAKLAKSVMENAGKIDDTVLENFFEAGYDKENLVDTIVAIGEKAITNMLHNVTKVPVDFPEAAPLN
ncbi:carboxymuconolactone decarboxylase family protein [Cyclobacterium salsum]|uniref:carboxymuconolactone decarboxylase family protein n=1 Tax=Cyclobacterium salsum TaxID=2666329 RepID=UPI001390ED7F|nr:carboxymuconolactone decarboxylase family protein [Cyclobacterium salsum]